MPPAAPRSDPWRRGFMVAQRVEGSARGRGGDRRGRRHGRRSRRWPHPIAAPRTPLRAPPPSPCVCAVSNRRGPTGRAHGRPHGRCPPPPGPQEVPIVRGGADAPFPPGWSACDSTKQRAPQGAPGSSQSILAVVGNQTRESWLVAGSRSRTRPGAAQEPTSTAG